MPMLLEKQWDERRGEIILVASRTDLPSRYAITVPALTEARAVELWVQWQKTYRDAGAEVRT